MVATAAEKNEVRYSGPERRYDLARRKRVDEMTREEMVRELLTDETTGLFNRRAWNEARRDNPSAVVAFMDADSLKWVNDRWGHRAGDALLAAISVALVDAGLTGYRTGGDEFAVQFANEAEAWSAMAQVARLVAGQPFVWIDAQGATWLAEGASLSFGIGEGEAAADDALAAQKVRREWAGLRASRGDQPPNIKRERVDCETTYRG